MLDIPLSNASGWDSKAFRGHVNACRKAEENLELVVVTWWSHLLVDREILDHSDLRPLAGPNFTVTVALLTSSM